MFNTLSKLKKIIRNDRGTTLVELILTASLLPIVLATAYFVLNQGLTTWNFADHKAEALGDARYLIDRMGTDLRQAQRPFLSVDTTNNNFILFKADIKSDAHEDPEIISYSIKPLGSDYDSKAIENGEKIVRSEYSPTFDVDDPNHLHPMYTNPPNVETMAKIVRNNKVTPKIPLFTFKKAGGVDFAAGDDISSIRMIMIDVYIKSVNAKDVEAVRISNAVRLRNF